MKKKIIKKPPEKVRVGQKDYFWRNLFYQAVYWIAGSPLPEIAFVAALVFSQHQGGSYFNYASQVWMPLLMFGFLASLAYLIYRLILGRGSAAHLAALLFSYGIYGYSIVNSTSTHDLFPSINLAHFKFSLADDVAAVVLIAAFAGVAVLAIRLILVRFTVFKNLQAYKIILSVVVLVFMIELIRFVQRYFVLH